MRRATKLEREAKVVLPKLTAGAAATVLALHLLAAMPVMQMGYNLLAPVAEMRVAERAMRDANRDSVQAIWQIINSMHYGLDADAFDAMVDALSEEELHAAVRSEANMQALAETMLSSLTDPYSGYAGHDKLARPASGAPFGLTLSAEPVPSEDLAAGEPASLLVVSGVSPNSAAEQAGVRMGDTVLAIKGRQRAYWYDWQTMLQADSAKAHAHLATYDVFPFL